MEMSRFKKLVLEVCPSSLLLLTLSLCLSLSLQTVAFSMSSGQIAQMREEFNLMDKDRSGTISMTELRSALARLYLTPHLPSLPPPVVTPLSPSFSGASPEHIENLFHSVDVDGSAEINYNEFVAAAMSKCVSLPFLLLSSRYVCRSLLTDGWVL
jgi:hypothetical protein